DDAPRVADDALPLLAGLGGLEHRAGDDGLSARAGGGVLDLRAGAARDEHLRAVGGELERAGAGDALFFLLLVLDVEGHDLGRALEPAAGAADVEQVALVVHGEVGEDA